jgi:hypothetical protein
LWARIANPRYRVEAGTNKVSESIVTGTVKVLEKTTSETIKKE